MHIRKMYANRTQFEVDQKRTLLLWLLEICFYIIVTRTAAFAQGFRFLHL